MHDKSPREMGASFIPSGTHPAAELFPPLGDEELAALAADIEKNGLLHPVVVNAAGVLLDGRNRLAACERADVEPTFVTVTVESEVDFIVSANLNRRHLTAGQRAMLAKRLLPHHEEEARRRQGRRTDLRANLPTSSEDGSAVDHEPGRARDKVGASLGVSGRAVATAKRLSEQAPDLAEKVERGELPLHRAELLAKTREDLDASRNASRWARSTRNGRKAPSAKSKTARPIKPNSKWSEEEKRLHKLMVDDPTATVVINTKTMRYLVDWAVSVDRYERIDRRTDWGNPFVLPEDGSRDEVVRNYRDVYLPYKPSVRRRLEELRGKALGCWCAPEACHGDVLVGMLSEPDMAIPQAVPQ